MQQLADLGSPRVISVPEMARACAGELSRPQIVATELLVLSGGYGQTDFSTAASRMEPHNTIEQRIGSIELWWRSQVTGRPTNSSVTPI
jgi:hypothetical protein